MANINKNKKVHFLYKSVNLITGTFYIGIHSTNKVEDSYIGSGKRFRNEVRKYGKINFKREILEFFDSREDALKAEYELVSTLISDSKCLNLCEGGKVGGLNEEARKLSKLKRDWLRANDYEWNKNVGDKVSKALLKYYESRPGTWTGKKHKPETIEKMKERARERGAGESNSQFGTCWITNDEINLKIRKDETLPEGWRFGRNLKIKV